MSEASETPSALDQARAAFERGNHEQAQALAAPLAASDDKEVAKQADELIKKMSPAPLGKVLFLLTGLLLLAVTTFAYTR
jgi:hypothetical protein